MKRIFLLSLILIILVGIGFYTGTIYGKKNSDPIVIYENSSVPSASFVNASMDMSTTQSEEAIAQSINNIFTRVSQRAIPAVVTIITEKVIRRKVVNPFFPEFDEEWFWRFFGPMPETEMKGTILGSGVIVNEKGYILTNNHVVEKGEKIHVRLINNKEYEAEVVGTDPPTDLAVLKIDARGLKFLPFGNSDSLKTGEWVLAIGCPLSENLAHTVTAGIVSAKGRSNIINPRNYEYFIQTDAAINPGNSGGALVNLRGELVGINTAIATSGGNPGNIGIGFAIPINLARKVMKDLIEKGKVARAWLGVWIQDVDDKIARSMKLNVPKGALISKVEKGSPADKAGLEVGDIIIEFDGKKVKNSSQLRTLVANSEPGSEKKLVIIRNGKERELKVKLAELPEEKLLTSGEERSETKLGFTVSNITEELAKKYDIDPDEEGVIITSIESRSQAAKVLRPGDIIKRVGNKVIDNVKEFNEAVESADTEVLLFLVKRSENTFFVTVDNPYKKK